MNEDLINKKRKEETLEITKSNEAVERFKHQWKALQIAQQQALIRTPKRNKPANLISSVEIIKDTHNKKTLKINTSNNSYNVDSNNKTDLSKEAPNFKITAQRMEYLIGEVLENGFDEVAATLSGRMRELLYQACIKGGINMQGEDAINEKKNLIRLKTMNKTNSEARNSSYNKDSISLFAGSSMIERFENSTPISRLNTDKMIEIEENYNYLDSVIERTENNAVEKYYDRIRIDILEAEKNIAKNNPLTETQLQSLEFSKAYGLSSKKENENPTQSQNENRKNINKDELPKDIVQQMNLEKKRYKSICLTKNNSLELASTLLACKIYQGENAYTKEDLKKVAYALIPKNKDRTLENLAKCRKEMEKKNLQSKDTLHSLKQEKKQYVSQKLAKTMNSLDKGKEKKVNRDRDIALIQEKSGRLVKKKISPPRHSFLNNQMLIKALQDKQFNR